ncbi:MAG: FAD synthase [Candidatus Buchananbacteria bacterium CG10_big_fil_rev_8_21_14_0_10_42_9]|uniref:FAD synthase n=1 Tax=Candidatus Buchananbacteria bacterium CG10_big_fil_rev_8_21_14_0_10_42_9 TaxID=1974526 RepID=A0A2H0W2C1_9BACT|nr:MAG: FAD synthase [Candidatus Buchananbacteria bacterium CG10_big_fil_rev_8_21_14_0_10_42_9]
MSKKVLIFGTFDGLHSGHLSLLKQAKKRGDKLAVIVARDATVKAVKGRLPQANENDRLQDIKLIKVVDEAYLGDKIDPYNSVRRVNPDIICLGYDQQVFTEKLTEEFPDIKVIRLKPYKPEIYKSSRINNLHRKNVRS